MTTSYCYGSQSNCLSGGAWHYDDDTLVRSDQRTWDQWRGFQNVWTSTGSNSDPVTETEDQYFQGMNADYQSQPELYQRRVPDKRHRGRHGHRRRPVRGR